MSEDPDMTTMRILELMAEIERLRGDLSESKIEVANLDMRLRHRVAEVNHLEGGIERLRARLAEAERLLREAWEFADPCPPHGEDFERLGKEVAAFLADQPSADLAKFAADLAAAQRPLDPLAEKVLYENLPDLYIDGSTPDKGSLADELQAKGMKLKPVGSK